MKVVASLGVWYGRPPKTWHLPVLFIRRARRPRRTVRPPRREQRS